MSAVTEQTATQTGLTGLDTVRPSIKLLHQIEQDLNSQLLERQEIIRASLVALVAKKHMVLIGPPGTAKSALINKLAERITPCESFIRLLTKFSTPDEIFGPIDVMGLKERRHEHIITKKLPEAHIAFLDEIFKANSAILNSLLTILNERQFDNGVNRIHTPLISLLGASNELPEGPELGALWDRFILRFEVGPISDSSFMSLLKLNGNFYAAPTATISLTELASLQEFAKQIMVPDGILEQIFKLRKTLQEIGITASDRRWYQSLSLLRSHALLSERDTVDEEDLNILSHALWEKPDQQPQIARIVARLANPLAAKVLELSDQATSVFDEAKRAHEQAGNNEQKVMAAVEGLGKLEIIAKEARALYQKAKSQGFSQRHLDKITKVGRGIIKLREQLSALAIGPQITFEGE